MWSSGVNFVYVLSGLAFRFCMSSHFFPDSLTQGNLWFFFEGRSEGSLNRWLMITAIGPTDNMRITLAVLLVPTSHSTPLNQQMQIASSPFAWNSGLLWQHGLCCWRAFFRKAVLFLVKEKAVEWNLNHLNGKCNNSLFLWNISKGRNYPQSFFIL